MGSLIVNLCESGCESGCLMDLIGDLMRFICENNYIPLIFNEKKFLQYGLVNAIYGVRSVDATF